MTDLSRFDGLQANQPRSLRADWLDQFVRHIIQKYRSAPVTVGRDLPRAVFEVGQRKAFTDGGIDSSGQAQELGCASRVWCDQQESNLYLILRRNLIYPLIYGHTRQFQARILHGCSIGEKTRFASPFYYSLKKQTSALSIAGWFSAAQPL